MEYTIFLTGKVGIYGRDAEYNPWATFEAINHTVACHECGVQINRGWARGKLGEEVHFCSSHMQVVRQNETHLG